MGGALGELSLHWVGRITQRREGKAEKVPARIISISKSNSHDHPTPWTVLPRSLADASKKDTHRRTRLRAAFMVDGWLADKCLVCGDEVAERVLSEGMDQVPS